MARTTQKQKLFNGRDHSWMQFNRRVLEEAEDPSNPLLERVKFLAITGSNLDEYVEIRQAGLMQRIEDGYREQGYDGLRPDESLAALTAEIHTFVDAQYHCWNDSLLPELRKQGIRLLEWDELDEEARAFAQSLLSARSRPAPHPHRHRSRAPLPARPQQGSLPRPAAAPQAQKLRPAGPRRGHRSPRPAALRPPARRRRQVRLPPSAGPDRAEPRRHVSRLRSASRTAFRVTRNSNLYFEEEEARSLLETIRVELHNRRKGDAVRLEIETGADPEIVERLRVNFELEEDQVFRGDGPVNLSRLMFFYSDIQRPDLKFPPFTPKPLHLSRKSTNIFDELRQHDILLHHPYDSYDPVVDFIQQGAEDPAVVSMKQTLYRTSQDSPVFSGAH